MDCEVQSAKFDEWVEELAMKYGREILDDCCIACQMKTIRDFPNLAPQELFYGRILFGSIFLANDIFGQKPTDSETEWLRRI